jgi:hypothetical protein
VKKEKIYKNGSKEKEENVCGVKVVELHYCR